MIHRERLLSFPPPGPFFITDRAATRRMADSDDLERRLAAVERAVDGDTDLASPGSENLGSETPGSETPDSASDEALETRLDSLESRVDELDAAVQAIRGFLGGVSAVNEAVERRADAAVAAVERLEARLDGEDSVAPTTGSPSDGGDGEHPSADDAESGLHERLRGHW